MASGPESPADAVSPADTGSAADVHDPGHHAIPVPLPPQQVVTAAGELLRALSAPLRIAIVLQLREGPRCVHELVDALGVTQPLVSQHLRVLKSSNVVSAHRQGREIRYELLDDHLVHIVEAAVGHAGEE
jgi:DNA-binding transcriptional ArsR family regulator